MSDIEKQKELIEEMEEAICKSPLGQKVYKPYRPIVVAAVEVLFKYIDYKGSRLKGKLFKGDDEE